MAFILIHIIGAIITIIIHFYDGTFEEASKYGDGIRFARPSDIAFLYSILWEIQFTMFIWHSIDDFVDDTIANKFF